MKRAFLLIVVPALLVALGFAQTPAASINTDQTNIKGCLGGSDGNYTVVQDNTGHIFKITSSSVDLKPHLGHDVTLIGHRASGVSSAAADNSFAVTELNMISEHCAAAAAAAAAAPAASISTPAETAVTPNTAAAAPAATVSTPAETAVTPAVAAAARAATVTTPAATVTTPAETAVAPAAPAAIVSTPAETVVAPAAPAATVSTPSETAATPAAATAHPTRLPAHPRKLPATPAAAATTPAATASTSSETASTPAAVATTPTPTARRGSLWLLIAFAVLVIVIGILTPSLSRWRKRKILERTGAPNLSLTREATSDQGKSDPQGPRKVA